MRFEAKLEGQSCLCHCLIVEGEEVSEDPEIEVYSCLQQLMAEELLDVHPYYGLQLFSQLFYDFLFFLEQILYLLEFD